MAWYLIIIGSALLLAVVYRIYLERKRTQNNHYNQVAELNNLNNEMTDIIDQITLKKNKIKDELTDLEKITNNQAKFSLATESRNDTRNSIDIRGNNATDTSKLDTSNNFFHEVYKQKVSSENHVDNDKTSYQQKYQSKTSKNNNGQPPARYVEALELYKNGYSVEEIAQKLSMGIRETELIFRLYGKEDVDVIR